MAKWICGYAGDYSDLDVLTFNVGGQIRRIVAGFYYEAGVVAAPTALTPKADATVDNEVMINSHNSVKIKKAAGLTNPVVFLLVETELEYPSKQAIP